MLKVDNFLGCCKLETGGLIIGWFYLIGYILSTIAFIILAILLMTTNCNDVNEIMKSYGQESIENCEGARGVIVAAFVIVALIMILFAWMAYCLIKGSTSRDHTRVKPMMIYMAVITVLALLNFLSFTLKGAISAIVYGVIFGYLFVVLYSLYELFREERERGFNAQYRVTGAKV